MSDALPRASLPALLLLAALLALPGPPARAQAPPHVDETHASLNWILGRWRMPITCELEDGSRVPVEEAVVFRPSADDATGRTVRATFFGLDVPGATRCFNVIEPNVPDRRGVLYLTFVSHGRPEMGLSNLRRTLEDGEISYRVTRGRLRIRDLSRPDEGARIDDYQGRSATLTVRLIQAGSDGDKLLTPFAAAQELGAFGLRRVSFEWRGDELAGYRGYYLEDGERRPGQRPRK